MAYRQLYPVVCVLMLLVGPTLVRGQTTERPVWTEPERLGSGWFSNITVDATGTAHLGWHGFSQANDDFLMYAARSPGGPRPGPEPIDVVLTATGGFTVRNAFDVDSKGILHAYYRSYTEHKYAQAPASNGASARQWLDLGAIGAGYYLDMMISQTDVIHLVSSKQAVNLATLNLEAESDQALLALTERFPCAFCSDLIYYRSEDNGQTWGTPINISNTLTGSDRPHLFEGRSGRIYVSWSEGPDWYASQGTPKDVRFVYSEDGGKSWADSVVLAGGDDPDKRPMQLALTEMSNGSLIAVWRYSLNGDRNIYYQISDDLGQTWSETAVIPYIRADNVPDSSLDRYELITDLMGTVHFFAVGFDAETNVGPALYHLEFRQGRWLPPTRLFYDPDIDRPEWPQADIGPGNELHLTYFIRMGNGRTEADVGDRYVYYLSRSGNLPDRVPLAAFAATPTLLPVPTEIPNFEPTPTAFPTLAPLEPNLQVDTNQDLYAIETLLAALVAVGLLCVGVLVIFGFRPRL